MGKDSKLKIEGYWIVLAFVILLGWLLYKEANAAEFELGPGLLSGEYSDGGTLIINEDIGHWRIGGGVVSKQYCHCNYPADLKENIFFHGQRIVSYKRLEAGIGAAYWQNTNRALGKNLTWSLSLGLVGEHWGLRFRHFSNAGSGSPNLGQDFLTVGYRF